MKPPRPRSSATLHANLLVHGVSTLDSGVRQRLFVCDTAGAAPGRPVLRRGNSVHRLERRVCGRRLGRRHGLRRQVAAARVQAAVAVAAGDGNCWRQLGRVGDSGGDCRLAAAVRATATAVSAHQRRVVGEAVSSWQLSWTSAGRQLGWKLERR